LTGAGGNLLSIIRGKGRGEDYPNKYNMNKDNNNKDLGQAHESIAAAAATDKQPGAKAAPSKPEKKDLRLCKAALCIKFKQGKCNGYCVACFNQFGATTCRQFHCINKIHKGGYCLSHVALANDDDTATTTTATKPASKSAATTTRTTTTTTKKKITTSAQPSKATSAQPSKQVKRKREHRIRYTFPATSSHQSLRIDANSKNPKHQTISKDDVLSLVNSVLKDTRHAKSTDGKALYLLDEIKDNIKRALEPSSHKVTRKPLKSEAPIIEIQGIPEESFTVEEIALMPVVFSYHCEDIESEQNAKIATLDYEVEQSRLKRKAATMGDENNSSSGQASKKEPVSPAEHKSDSPFENETEDKEADDEFPPSGWSMQHIPRRNATSSRPFDTYYYSPELQLKFRSKVEVKRFVALLFRGR